MPDLRVHFLPTLTTPDELAGRTVVVIDVLRATTTITAALAAGAARVIPCGEVDEARRIAASLASADGRAADRALTGGERGGLPIDGFDLGNSPAAYTPSAVGGRTIVFTTTNGTQAMLRCRQARRVLLASFVNLTAVAAELREAEEVHLLCAGTRGEITREDVLAAGAIVHALLTPADGGIDARRGAWQPNDSARIARDAWQATLPPAELRLTCEPAYWLIDALAASQGGRNLQAIGLARDIADCAALDRWPLVARLDVARWEIVGPTATPSGPP